MSLLFSILLVVSSCMDSPSILVSPSQLTTSTISATNLVATTNPLASTTSIDLLATVFDHSQPANASTSTVSLAALNSPLMRTEAEFLEQAELARSALQQFAAIQDFENADDLKRGALIKLIKAIVRNFSFFSSVFSVSYYPFSIL